MPWDITNDRPSEAIVDAFRDAAANITEITLYHRSTKPYGAWRPELVLNGIPNDTYRELFNSPQELRGNYYRSVHDGRFYTAELLYQMVKAIDWPNVTIRHHQAVTTNVTNTDQITKVDVQVALHLGKIWTTEDGITTQNGVHYNNDLITSDDWEGQDTHPFPKNERWIPNPTGEDYDQLFQQFRDEGQVDLDAVNSVGNYQTDPIRQGVFMWGHQYWESGGVDIKGSWSDRFVVPARKRLRSLTIKWFGFS